LTTAVAALLLFVLLPLLGLLLLWYWGLAE
jgi:hypothetical protein